MNDMTGPLAGFNGGSLVGPDGRVIAQRLVPPDAARLSLRLFAERGRLPFYEDETFARDSWLAVLLGHDMIPRRTDPLIDAVPPAQTERAMAAMRALQVQARYRF